MLERLCLTSTQHAQDQRVDTSILKLQRSLIVEKNGEKLPRSISKTIHGERVKILFRHGALKTPFYASPKDVIDSAVEINKTLGNGDLSRKEVDAVIRRAPIGHCKDSLNVNEKRVLSNEIKKGSIVPLGFKVIDSFTPNGTPRHQGVLQYAFPCVEKED